MRSTSAEGEGWEAEAEAKAARQTRKVIVRASSEREDLALEGAILMSVDVADL